ncbi:signal peptide plus GPI signal or transmembrane domain at C-terminus [Cryptosporidium sp. chipmunk genotype I]|uniref:signal peptide plus GPI signal or transmembrane domain at C-terminus n=1 Tax=Cryptosporidium sp. chipmunk genotype I TaxID=1280935 RepID=UPI00351A4E40|nr:signal peptide plus GPI signal or transmembrane domain at C-terminus [Cryptosporidium sp. chipmunk genotype I]
MRLEVLFLFSFLVFNINYSQGLGLRKDYGSYSESAYTDIKSSDVKDSESGYSDAKDSSEVLNKSIHVNKAEKSNFTSQVESEDYEDDEPGPPSTKVKSDKYYSEKNDGDDDDYDNSESIEVKSSKRQPQNKEVKKGEVNMPQVQYMARQQRFNLASTVNPPSDVSNINYVFLSPAAQRRIDRKISKLQRGGKYHGSMKETKAIGEWQKRYYSRPETEYNEIRTSSQGSSSMFTWVILGFILILLAVICICGIRFVAKE